MLFANASFSTAHIEGGWRCLLFAAAEGVGGPLNPPSRVAARGGAAPFAKTEIRNLHPDAVVPVNSLGNTDRCSIALAWTVRQEERR